MLYLFWALLNLGLAILFLVFLFKATKYIKERLGLLAAVVFAVVLLSFMGSANNDKGNNGLDPRQVVTPGFNSDSMSNRPYVFVTIDLAKTLISKYSLGVTYGKDKHLHNIPVTANAWLTGFESGTSWKPNSIIVNLTDDNMKFEYQVEGTVKWTLLGLPVYYQSKTWKGTVLLN
jgi:hypothetical protein